MNVQILIDSVVRCAIGDDPVRTARRCGCGMINVTTLGGFGGEGWVFDDATGALIGYAQDSDAPETQCNTFGHVGSVAFECPDADTEIGFLCGEQPEEPIPPCE